MVIISAAKPPESADRKEITAPRHPANAGWLQPTRRVSKVDKNRLPELQLHICVPASPRFKDILDRNCTDAHTLRDYRKNAHDQIAERVCDVIQS